MITRQEISQFFIIILFQSILFSQIDSISIPETLDPDQSYFSILISPDKSYIGLTNSNYTTLEIINQKTLKNAKVSVPFINTFQAKWSPDSEKLLLLRCYLEKNLQLIIDLKLLKKLKDFFENFFFYFIKIKYVVNSIFINFKYTNFSFKLIFFIKNFFIYFKVVLVEKEVNQTY